MLAKQIDLLAEHRQALITTAVTGELDVCAHDRRTAVMTETVHQLRVTLRQVKPPAWRRIVVESHLALGELEAAMGSLGGHFQVFEVDRRRYGTPEPEWPSDDLDENRVRLGDVLPDVGMKMRWDYDFGDGWEHDVLGARSVPSSKVPSIPSGEPAHPKTATVPEAMPSCWGSWPTRPLGSRAAPCVGTRRLGSGRG